MTDRPDAAPKSARSSIPPVVRIALLVGVIVAAGAIVWSLQGRSTTSAAVPRVGGPAPDFALQDASGKTVNLAQVRGQPVIVNFWATWCPPCKAEMPAISAVARANPKSVVLAVDELEGPALVYDYISTMDLGFTPLLDPMGTMAAHYHVNSIPTSFFIGADGIIRAINVGPMDQPTIEQNLRRAQS